MAGEIPTLQPVTTPIAKVRRCEVCGFPLAVDQEQLCDECAARSA